MQKMHRVIAEAFELWFAVAMDLAWLEDFLSLARTGSFSQSAAERNITQPAFGRRIRALERWLGTTLINRETFPANLTAQGEMFHETAQRIVSSLYLDRSKFQAQLEDDALDIRIVGATTLNNTFIPDWLKSLDEAVNAVNVNLITKRFTDMPTLLDCGEVDLAMQYAHPDTPVLFTPNLFETLLVGQEDFIFTSPVNPQTGQAMFDPTDGAQTEIPYMGYSEDGYFSELEKLIFGRNPAQAARFRRISEAPSSDTVKNLSLTFDAVTCLPMACAREEISRSTLIPIGGKSWKMQLNVELYRSIKGSKTAVQKIWTRAQMMNRTCETA